MDCTEFHDHIYLKRIKILGGIIEVRCKYYECLEGIEAFFSASITDAFITPDIIIYCNWKKADRYLFRTRPKEDGDEFLPGVFYQKSGSTEILPWDSYDPPLPPFIKKPFINSFVGLHAGAIKGDKNNAILFIGSRGSGKTTSTLELVNNFEQYELLTDETVFIRKRSLLVEPFPRLVLPRAIADGEIKKYSLRADQAYKRVAKQPAIVTHGFFLKKDIGGPFISKISSIDAYRNIVEHYKYAGTGLKESMITLSLVAQEAEFSVISYKNYEDLKSILRTVPSYLEGLSLNEKNM